jgi:hypothetical protein
LHQTNHEHRPQPRGVSGVFDQSINLDNDSQRDQVLGLYAEGIAKLKGGAD